ncbi:methylmalonyl-CoA epimerase [Natronomonas pharaonis DSM 2160]|uniref:Methylmalonyl-CoA epimerase n=1 Tax=Natronomonas pharaonis (strain ATCC 35678 / DSM 2160 / CIP 103997 / JCM 8858 / NBRC 14720 / NCIMB 2260 / Gabara) TaxID=348780 RepID=A0A1U7EUQ0_NATPD|nr:methylmalonyl-CoA epimerase [Natronomonas pharaonis]CAI48705.1 methylmalonyl-CoA epimerase [Natronomonas pharaonis DSM 2160]
MRFDHAGVATDDAEGLAFLYEDLFGCSIAHEERFGELKVLFLELENGYFELLEPQDDGTIASYLDEHGPGLHHIALETTDINAALETATDLGVECIDEAPRQGAWGHQVAFLHPKSTGGVLIEYVEH